MDSSVSPLIHEALRSPGQPLDPATRTFMEPRFGHDFSGVRVHTDAKARESARAVNALAYTVGQDLVFGAGLYQPGTTEGRKLLAHELTHVVQQSGGHDRVQGSGLDYDAYELEADRASETVLRGGRVREVTTVPAQMVQRAGVAEFLEEQAWSFVRDNFPDVEPYLRNPGRLWSSMVDSVGEAIGNLVNRVVAPLREIHPLDALKGLFGPLLSAAATAFKTKDCAAFFEALNKFKAKIALFTAGPLDALQEKFSRIRQTIQDAIGKVTAPFAKLLEQAGGAIVNTVKGIANRVSSLMQKAKEWSTRAWTWVTNKLGFGGEGSGEGVWELIKRKAGEAWEKAKPAIAPWIGPLKTAATVLLALSPFGPVIAAVKFGPKIAGWLGDAYNYLRVPERIGAARATIARLLPMISKQLAQAPLVLAGIPPAIEGLRVGSRALNSLGGALAEAPVLGLAGDAMKFVATKIDEGVTWVGGPVNKAIHAIEAGMKNAGAWLDQVGHGAGKLIEIAVNPLAIVGFLAGEIWLSIPSCFKLPVLNWILDLLMRVVRAIPANPLLGPMFPLFLHGVIGFLQRVRDGGKVDEKVTISDRLARLVAGSATFLLGLTWGVVKGVGEGLMMPFTMLYDIITAVPKIVDFVNALPAKIANAIGGIARSVADTANAAIAGFWPAVRSALSTPGGGMLEWLKKGWDGLSKGAEGVGGSVAAALIGFIMLSDFDLGEKLGWVAGSVLFEVALAYITGGAAVLLKAASVPLRLLGKVLRVLVKAHEIMNQIFGLIFKALEPAINGIRKLLGELLPSLEPKVGAILRKFEELTGSAKTAGEDFAGKFAGDDALSAARGLEGGGALGAGEGMGTRADPAGVAPKEKPAIESDLPADRPPAPKAEETPLHAAAPEPHPAAESVPQASEMRGQTPETAKPIDAPPAESPAARERSVAESGKVESIEMSGTQLSDELDHVLDNPQLMEGVPPHRTAKIGDHTWHENPNGAWCRHSSTEVCVRFPADRQRALREAQARLEAAEQRAERARTRADEARAHHSSHSNDLAGWEAEATATQAKIEEQEARLTAMRNGAVNGDIAAAEQELARLRNEATELQDVVDKMRKAANDASRVADETSQSLTTAEGRAKELSNKKAEHLQMAADIDRLEAQREAVIAANNHMIPSTSSELGTKLRHTESEIKATKQRLSDEMYATRGVTPEVRADLRGRTPPQVGSRERNALLDSFSEEFAGPGGKILDPATGLPLSQKVYIDHVVPFDEIVQMEGFNQLTRQQQLEVLNLRANLMPQSGAMSSSKWSRSMAEFFDTPLGKTIPIERRAALLAREKAARTAVEDAIKERIAL